MAESGSKHPEQVRESLHRHIGEAVENAAGKLREKLHSTLSSMLEEALGNTSAASHASSHAAGEDPWMTWLPSLLGAADASEAMQALLDSASSLGKRAAIFVIRGDYGICWQASGMNAPDPVALSGNSTLAAALRAAKLVQWGPKRNLPIAVSSGVQRQDSSDGTAGSSLGGMYPIVVRGKPVAALHWDAAPTGNEWGSEQRVWLLVQVTSLMLERLLGQTGKRSVSVAPATSNQPSARSVAAAATAAPSSSPAPMITIPATSNGSDADRRARRYAKVLVEDLELYVKRDRPEALDEGRRNRDLYVRLKDDLDKARKSFLEKFPPGTGIRLDVLDQEVIRVLARGDASALGSEFASSSPSSAPAPPSRVNPQLEVRARRHAKVLMEDLELYLQRDRADVLNAGRQHHDLYRRLQEDIDKCRQSFTEKFPASTGVSTQILEQELIRVLCKGDRRVLGSDYSGL